MVGGESFIDIGHFEDINIAKIGKNPYSFVIDKVSSSLPAWIPDIELTVFPGLQHFSRAGNGACCHGGI